jgi:hypothetical protein
MSFWQCFLTKIITALETLKIWEHEPTSDYPLREDVWGNGGTRHSFLHHWSGQLCLPNTLSSYNEFQVHSTVDRKVGGHQSGSWRDDEEKYSVATGNRIAVSHPAACHAWQPLWPNIDCLSRERPCQGGPASVPGESVWDTTPGRVVLGVFQCSPFSVILLELRTQHLKATVIRKGGRQGRTRGSGLPGCSPPPISRLKETDFVGTVISKVLRDWPFSRY